MEENNNGKITFLTEDNEEVELVVLEQTTLNGINYLLVAEDEEDDDEETTAYIMKDVSSPQDTQAVYDMVEDDKELELIGKIFEELLDDTEIK